MPKIDEDGHIVSDEPMNEASVRAHLEALLEVLRASAQDCAVHRSVISACEGYSETTYANIAGEYGLQADTIHRDSMGDLWQHLPDCVFFQQ